MFKLFIEFCKYLELLKKMFRVIETSESHGDDLNGDSPIRIQVNSSGNSVRDDASTSYNTGPFRTQFNAPLSMPPVQSIFAQGRTIPITVKHRHRIIPILVNCERSKIWIELWAFKTSDGRIVYFLFEGCVYIFLGL